MIAEPTTNPLYHSAVRGEIRLGPVAFLTKKSSGPLESLVAAIYEVQNMLDAEYGAPIRITAISHEWSDESFSALVVYEKVQNISPESLDTGY